MAKKSTGNVLIQGAAAIGQAKLAKGRANLQAGLGIADAISGVATDFVNYIDKQNEEYQGYAQKVLDEAGHLPAEEYSALYDDLMQGKKGYMFGGSKGQALSIRDLNMKAQDYGDYKDFRLNLSQLTLDGNEDGDKLSKYFSGTSEGMAYLDLLKDNSRLKQKVCPDEQQNCPDKGRMGVMMVNQEGEEEWTSISDLKRKLNKNLFDKGFKSGLYGLSDKIQEASLRVQEGEQINFPQKLMEQKVNLLVTDAANRKSVAYDDMFGNTSFFEDLTQKLTTEDYKSLGIPEATIKKLDTNGGKITPQDAERIARELIDNPQYEDLAVSEMTRYYTGFLRQNFNDAAAGRSTTKEGYELTKGGRRVKIKPQLGDFPKDIDLTTEDDFASEQRDFSQYDNITIGGERLSDILMRTDSEDEVNRLINTYANVMPNPRTTVQPTAE
tara:strand:- start:149 stop:1468 length:1320 start_codon:yes stop_codon:yes gene_type:complete